MSGGIPAIPTMYRGRQYRSRLEARWAAFFDLIGWQHEYEPFDLGSWSPNFLLISSTHRQNVLVEVKPVTEPDYDVGAKMVRAARERARDETLLLLGTAPTWKSEDSPRDLTLGWYVCLASSSGAEDFYLEDAAFKVWADATGPIVDFSTVGPFGTLTGFSDIEHGYSGRLGEPPDRAPEFLRADLLYGWRSKSFRQSIHKAWAEASNAWHYSWRLR